MKISNYTVFFACIFLAYSFSSCSNSETKHKTAKTVEKGVLDLQEWDFEKDGVVQLNGEWEFYWNSFIKNEQSIDTIHTSPGYLHMPGLWNNYLAHSLPIGNFGYASYRLMVNVSNDEELAIKYLNSATSCAVFVDGVLLHNAGKPAQNKENTKPGYQSNIVTFHPQNNEIEIVLQIANFHHKKGGQWEPLVLGTQKQIRKYSNRRVFIDVLGIGLTLIMAIFHFTLYSKYKNDKPLLYFAFFTLFISIHLAVSGEYTIYMLGDFNWFLIIRSAYLSFYLLVLFFILYVKSLFPGEIPKHIATILLSVTTLFILSVLLLPVAYFSYGIQYFQLFTIVSCIYGFYVLYKAYINQREGVVYFMYGFVVLFLCLVHDILKGNELIFTIPLASFGLTIFILFHSYFLSLRVRKAFEINKILSAELQKQNDEYLFLNGKYKEQNKKLSIAKEKAEENENLYKGLVDSSHNLIWKCDLNGTIIFLNPEWEKSLGYTIEEMIGKQFSSFQRSEVYQRDKDSITEQLKLGFVKDYETLHLKKDGTEIPVIINALPLFDGKGEMIGTQGTAFDISKLKATEKKLIEAKEKAEESDRLKTTFLQNMTHEIRTPMNAIIGFSQLLDDTDLSEEDRRSYVSIIQNSTHLLLDIVNDILTVSLLETKQEKLNEKEFCINEIILELFNIYKIKCAEINISLTYNNGLSDKRSVIKSDKVKITQIITNLLNNALKFTENGSIEFGYHLTRNELEFYVKDTGIGIPKEQQALIFERFQQADKVIQADYGGTGLGLSICKGFIQLLGGKISVQSNVGEGATFSFTIPYHPIV